MCNCRNIGNVDRAIRAMLGVVALVLAFALLGAADGSATGIVVAAIGGVLAMTALIGFCPAYVPLGLSTCKVGSQ